MSITHGIVRLVTLVAFAAATGSQVLAALPDSTSAVADTTPALAEPAPRTSFRLVYQFGLGLRLGDRPSYDLDSDNLMLTFELTGMRWDGHSTTWGLGVRGAMDDLGFRLGPKALVRRPLGGGGEAYYQLAATYYLFSGDGDLADRPGWALEAEIAPLKALSFVLGLELMQYNLQDYTTGDDPSWVTESLTSTYLGVKVSQWWGVAVTAALFAMAGLYASSGP